MEHSWGIATGATPLESQKLAGLVEQSRAVLVDLQGFEERPLRVHMTDDLPPAMVGLAATKPFDNHYVLIRRGQEHMANTVAHELVHHYFFALGNRLPPIIEEGLCDVIAARVTGEDAALESRVIMAAVSYLDNFTLKVRGVGAKRLLPYVVQDVPSISEALSLDNAELFLAGVREKDAYYGLGTTLVTAIGVERLLAAAEALAAESSERLSPQEILELAGLVPLNQEALVDAFAKAIGLSPGTGSDLLTITIRGEG